MRISTGSEQTRGAILVGIMLPWQVPFLLPASRFTTRTVAGIAAHLGRNPFLWLPAFNPPGRCLTVVTGTEYGANADTDVTVTVTVEVFSGGGMPG